MAFIIRILLLTTLHLAMHAAEPLQLSNDATYDAQLAATLNTRADSKDQAKLFAWISSVATAYGRDRRYGDAETAARAALAIYPQYSYSHSNLSVYLGKQGKYEEALREAEIARLLNPEETWHADAVASSWLYCLGRKAEADARFAAIAVPAEPHAAGAYWSCKAAFAAQRGDVADMTAAMKESLQANPAGKPFFERDIFFDRYRKQPWFIALVGETVK